jgi:integrase
MSKRFDRKRPFGMPPEVMAPGRHAPAKPALPDPRPRDGLAAPPPRTGRRRPSWKRALQDIITAHNDRHATKPKSVSFKTQTERACSLFRCFRDLHSLGYKIRNPYCLGGRHIRALVADWTSSEPRARRARLSPAMIHAELSHLRTFSAWVNKPGLVRPAEAYVSDAALVARRYAATRDHSWRAREIDADKLIEEIAAHDAWVGAELRLARAFGLRVKETVMLKPRLAEVPSGQAADPSGHPGPYLEVLRGTKGGRLRHIPIDTPAKRAALDAAQALVAGDSQHLADPRRTLIQNLNRLGNVLKKFSVTKRALGVTAHGLRHEYAGDRYEAAAGVSPPVRGGTRPDRETDHSIRLRIARELGHSRVQIVAAYLGSPDAAGVCVSAAGRDATRRDTAEELGRPSDPALHEGFLGPR